MEQYKRYAPIALVLLALGLIGLSIQRYMAGGGLDWFSLVIAVAALGLLLLNLGQSDDED